jgi:putative tryptophan/tyrosine transport system permease protein
MEFLNIYTNLFSVSLVQGAIFAFPALAVMIPFRILSLPDLTSEGAFPFGAAIAATLTVAGLDPIMSLLAAILFGLLVGATTALIHLYLRIPSLLAGIIVLTMLFSINIRVMGKPNTALFDNDSVFTLFLNADGGEPTTQFLLILALVFVLCGIFYWLLNTELGIALRCVGANQAMSRAQGIPTHLYIIAGLAMAGGFSAFGGAVMAQHQAYADVNMGVGVLIVGLAATILGETLIGRQSLLRQIAAPVVGSLAYFQVVAIALALGLKPSDLKLLTGIFVLATLAIPIILQKWKDTK